MLISPSRYTYLAAIVLATAAAGAIGWSAVHWGQAQAQGLMSAPACQCSPTTPIASMSTVVVHCICGGMSCVISEHKDQGKSIHLMQCVK